MGWCSNHLEWCSNRPGMVMQQPSGAVHQLPGMMHQPYGMMQQQPDMMQQPSGMVQQLPGTMQPPPEVLDKLDVGEPWATGLFDCFQNPTNAIITAYLPCVTFGQIAEVLDEGEMNCALGSYIYLVLMPALCSHWLMGSKYRAKLRRKYNLVEAPFPDMVSHMFCPCCALAQEFRELKTRGLDPSLGWKQIHKQQMENPPPSQSMTR
ncbi:hypothetical protein NL676_026886 [Syzygium grande]|nr:hypothetical protein NL676_026886 [Syzygium grande]